MTKMPAQSRLGRQSTVEFFSLRIRKETDGTTVIGRADTGDFIAVPDLGSTIISELTSGMQVGQVEESLLAQGVRISVGDFVGQLQEFGFIRSVDGIPVPGAPPLRRESLPWLRPHHVAWLFSTYAYTTYVLIISAALGIIVADPRVRPHYSDIFISGITSLVLVGSTVLFLVIVALHEFAHLASARASDVPARISFGTRLYSLVAQTDVSGMWAASPRERLRTYLAGMVLDLVLAGTLVLIREALGVNGRLDHVLAAAVVIILIGIAGQFQLFMRTDVYFVAAHFLKARNLQEDATVHLIYSLQSMIRKEPEKHPLASLPGHERRVVKAYSLVMIVGTAGALAFFAAYLLPALVLLLVHGAYRMFHGATSGNPLMALDGTATVLVEGGTQLLIVMLFLRSRASWSRGIRNRYQRPKTRAVDT